MLVNIKQGSLLLLSMVLPFCIFAEDQAMTSQFKCIAELYKAPCWKDYDVTLIISTKANLSQQNSLLLEKGKMKGQVEFPCQPNDQLALSSKYAPAVWADDKDRIFPATTNWFIPAKIGVNDEAYYISICYPRHFKEVPLPISQNPDCDCILPGEEKQR